MFVDLAKILEVVEGVRFDLRSLAREQSQLATQIECLVEVHGGASDGGLVPLVDIDFE